MLVQWNIDINIILLFDKFPTMFRKIQTRRSSGDVVKDTSFLFQREPPREMLNKFPTGTHLRQCVGELKPRLQSIFQVR